MPDALIVGGGVGGLAAALALHSAGWTPLVLERAEEIAEVGAGIQISANGYRVLEALGVADVVAQAAFQPEAIEMRMGKSGQRLVRIPMGQRATRRWGAPYLQVHRADLIEALRAALEVRVPGAIRTGANVTGYDADAAGVVARLADGTALRGDILIGADGLRSTIRAQMQGADKPHFTGMVAWRATVPRAALAGADVPDGACIWAGADRHAVTYPIRRGEMVNFVGMVKQDGWTEEGWSVPGTQNALARLFGDWATPVARIVEAAETPMRWALYDRPPLSRWHEGRVALLGDACHPMLPSLAQGACQALEDAMVLAQTLREYPPEAAFPRYYIRRFARVSRVQREARANLHRFHWSSPLAALPVRVIATLSPIYFQRRLDWLYGA